MAYTPTSGNGDQERRLLELLSDAERGRAELLGARARTEFVTGRAIARSMLAQALGVPPERVPLTERGGRPEVMVTGGWCVSLSHSGEAVACAVSMRAVGLDIQQVASAPGAALLARTCSPAEITLVRRSADPAAAFTQLWARKEAVSKALQVGVALPFARTDVRSDVVRGVGGGLWRVAEVDVGTSHRAAVAARGVTWVPHAYLVRDPRELLG